MQVLTTARAFGQPFGPMIGVVILSAGRSHNERASFYPDIW
jgi:hypothetical protein